MRIDEFSSPTDIDGAVSGDEKSRFLTFGFSIVSSDTPTIVIVAWSEKCRLLSPVSSLFRLNSPVTTTVRLLSDVVEVLGG